MQKECKLPNDAWVLIGLHLKPRHLSKLLRVSKKMRQLLDNNAYWTRVAAQLVWREKECLEIGPWDRVHFAPIEVNLYDMLALDRGYFWGMELFFGRLSETIDFYSKNDDEKYRSWWDNLKAMSLEEKTRQGIKSVDEDNYNRTPFEEPGMTMKQVAKKSILASYHLLENADVYEKKFNKFVTELEDDPMPAAFKRAVMGKVNRILWDCSQFEKEKHPSEIAFGICKFGAD
jgi:hypothetical protein